LNISFIEEEITQHSQTKEAKKREDTKDPKGGGGNLQL
jgi:hypothetical protein